MVFVLLFGSLGVRAQSWPDAFDRPEPTDQNVTTGPQIGETIPNFEARDQDGHRLDFNAIKGPKGAALLFFRSADW